MRDVSRVKAIIFDLDNTLIDFMKMKTQATEAAVEAMIDAGLKIEKEKALKIINKLYKKFGIEYQKVFDEFLKEVLGEVDQKILAAGVVAYRRIKEGYVEPYPHVIPTLIELIKRGYILCIISDAPAFQAWSRLAGMKLHHFFDFVIAFEATRVKKPHELPFKLALKKLKLKPEEIMMVGDDPRRDIEGAKKLGMVTVLAKYGQIFKSKRIKADFEIDDIKELLEILGEKKVEKFHRNRRMFCIKDDKLFIAKPGLPYSHKIWFKKKGWNEKSFNKIIRGFVDKSGNLYFYVGNFEVNELSLIHI